MSDVFISYARSTADQAEQVAAALRALGHGVWRDDELPAHRAYAEVIEERLKAAKAVVVIWSAEAVKSQWVRAEANVAREAGTLVQLRLDDATPPLPFNEVQCADMSGWAGDLASPGWRKVVASVSELLRPAAASGPTVPPAAAPRGLSVCVLPFANMSGDPEQEYFSDGISEDIITDLSQVGALSVISRNSAFQFKGQHVDVRQVARQLGVSHVLEGSVRKAGGRVRITAQLIEGVGDSHVWAERYDRDLDDIFAVQDEISQAIVAALKLKLLPEEKTAITRRGTSSAEAYDLYLMARQILIDEYGDQTGHQTVVRLCQRAVDIDPAYAQAWALMAMSQSTLHIRYEALETGLDAAERATSLDRSLPEPHAIKARHDFLAGREADADAELAEALRLGPDSPEVQACASMIRFRQRRLKEAAAHYERSSALLETSFAPAAMLMSCYAGLGDEPARRRAAQLTLDRVRAALEKDERHALALAYGASALAILGDRDQARAWVSRAALIDPDNRSLRYNLVCALTGELRDVEAALELFTPYIRTASASEVGHTEVDPDLDALRPDPRYQALIAEAKARLAGA